MLCGNTHVHLPHADIFGLRTAFPMVDVYNSQLHPCQLHPSCNQRGRVCDVLILWVQAVQPSSAYRLCYRITRLLCAAWGNAFMRTFGRDIRHLRHACDKVHAAQGFAFVCGLHSSDFHTPVEWHAASCVLACRFCNRLHP